MPWQIGRRTQDVRIRPILIRNRPRSWPYLSNGAFIWIQYTQLFTICCLDPKLNQVYTISRKWSLFCYGFRFTTTKEKMVIWVPRISFFDWRPDIFEYIVSNIRGFWFFGNFIIPLREQGEALNNSHKGLIRRIIRNFGE